MWYQIEKEDFEHKTQRSSMMGRGGILPPSKKDPPGGLKKFVVGESMHHFQCEIFISVSLVQRP